MPSEPLTRDNDYKAAPAPEKAIIDRAAWNEVMGSEVVGNEGIGPRLRALEAQRVTLEDVIEDLKLFGLDRLDTAIGGLLTTVEDTIAELQAELAIVEANFNAILEGGIGADDVVETATRVFLTPEQRDEIATKADADAVALALGEKADAEATATALASLRTELREEAKRLALMT